MGSRLPEPMQTRRHGLTRRERAADDARWEDTRRRARDERRESRARAHDTRLAARAGARALRSRRRAP